MSSDETTTTDLWSYTPMEHFQTTTTKPTFLSMSSAVERAHAQCMERRRRTAMLPTYALVDLTALHQRSQDRRRSTTTQQSTRRRTATTQQKEIRRKSATTHQDTRRAAHASTQDARRAAHARYEVKCHTMYEAVRCRPFINPCRESSRSSRASSSSSS